MHLNSRVTYAKKVWFGGVSHAFVVANSSSFKGFYFFRWKNLQESKCTNTKTRIKRTSILFFLLEMFLFLVKTYSFDWTFVFIKRCYL